MNCSILNNLYQEAKKALYFPIFKNEAFGGKKLKPLEPSRGKLDSLETNPGRLRKTFLQKVKRHS